MRWHPVDVPVLHLQQHYDQPRPAWKRPRHASVGATDCRQLDGAEVAAVLPGLLAATDDDRAGAPLPHHLQGGAVPVSSGGGAAQESGARLDLCPDSMGLAFIVIMTSLKYVRHSENITLKFLIQSFLSVCLHFAGVYILVFLFEREKSWNVEKIRSFRDGWKRGDDESVFWGVVLDFIYYSITTMTTAGYGDMSPRSPTAISMVIIQMLASAIFVQVILALGVSMVSTATLDVPSEFEQQFIDDGYSSVDPSDTPWGWKESQRSDRESSARPTNSMKSDSAASISTFSFPSSVHTNTPGTAVNETNSLLRKGGGADSEEVTWLGEK
eukprot:CAMPEP_0175119648 /NCGR_PEP_ID=MMETSP0087-20121206/180_1 /TAXON_ID=136419 /ORGANISM="Unknown Unknown, Strain D1" /LENGTH=326 /DNA_ID=CAMNT_0016401003 /DNA_START=640 /DNA_END=1619 /DNA_ORIENTATION=-